MLNSFLKTERNYWYLYFAMSFVYVLFFSGITAHLLTFARYDDALYFNMANSILAKQWLGKYFFILLSKVPGYGIFLACCMATGMPYMLLIAICNALAVAFFLKTSSWLFDKKRYLSLVMGVIILFNPIFAVVSRIYRNPFAAICFLIFIGTIAAMFNPEKQNDRKILRILMGAISFLGIGFLFYTREETLLYTGILVVALSAFLVLKYKRILVWQNLRLLMFGVAGVVLLGLSISFLNYRYYGVFTVCEKTSGAYPKAMKAFQQVADPWQDDHLPGICPSHKKIERIAQVVPEFKPLADEMLDPLNIAFKASSRYFNVDSMQIIKQDSIYIPASHFEWYWIVSLKRAGYYTDAKKAADYQRLIARKINGAISDGQLEKRNILVSMGPYFIMKQDVMTILKMLPRNYINRFYTPNHFHKSFMNLAVRKSRVENAPEMEKRWAAALNVNYISANDNGTQKMLMNKLVNHFWNLVVKLFSWLVVPLFHLTTPLAFLAIFLCIKNRVWHRALPLVVMIIGFWTHLAMLTAIDVVVGYKASNHAYFLPSYAIIIAAFFISLAVIVEYLRADRKMHLSERTVAPDESQK